MLSSSVSPQDGLGALFTDEGFALGVAYLLRVLGVDKAFDNIHWHASAARHYSTERRTVQAEAARLGAEKRSAASAYLGLGRGMSSSDQDTAQSLEIRQGRAAAYLEVRGRPVLLLTPPPVYSESPSALFCVVCVLRRRERRPANVVLCCVAIVQEVKLLQFSLSGARTFFKDG